MFWGIFSRIFKRTSKDEGTPFAPNPPTPSSNPPTPSSKPPTTPSPNPPTPSPKPAALSQASRRHKNKHLTKLPSSILFFDVETTGLHSRDRIVSFAGIGLQASSLTRSEREFSYSHLIFDPGKKSHLKAEEKHGYSDWVLRFQDPFTVHAEVIWNFLHSYDEIVAHNAKFDVEFINREFIIAGLPKISKPVYCTMEGFRTEGIGGSASLNSVCRGLELSRKSKQHGALEDAWLAMQVYLWLHRVPIMGNFPVSFPPTPINYREAPPAPDGQIPRRRPLRRRS